jgi:hypothetical protein
MGSSAWRAGRLVAFADDERLHIGRGNEARLVPETNDLASFHRHDTRLETGEKFEQFGPRHISAENDRSFFVGAVRLNRIPARSRPIMLTFAMDAPPHEWL